MRPFNFMRKAGERSPDEKIFFFHLPKCAGTSVWSALHDIAGKRKVLQVSSHAIAERFREMPPSERSAYDAIGGHFELDLYQTHLDLKNYLCVTTFRDPVSRIVSEYHYASHNPRHSHHSIISRLSLAEFICWQPNPITN